jgi:ketosteroid isomerase-like protein
MSNVEVVRSLYAAWERGDWGSAAWAHPNIEFVICDGPDPRTLHGVDAMAAGWREFLTAWSGYGVEAEEYRELPGERVLVVLRAVGRGKKSGVALGDSRRKGANIFHLRAGKVARLVIYFDIARALEDLGGLEQ